MQIAKEYPLLWERGVTADTRDRLGQTMDPLDAECDAVLREIWMARRTPATAQPSLREVELARSVGRLEEALRATVIGLETAIAVHGAVVMDTDEDSAAQATAIAAMNLCLAAAAALVGVEPPHEADSGDAAEPRPGGTAACKHGNQRGACAECTSELAIASLPKVGPQ